MTCIQCEKEIPESAANCAYCGHAVGESVSKPPAVPVAQSFVIASRGKRFLNLVIDGIVLQFILKALDVVDTSFVIDLVGGLVFYAAFEILTGKTPGKFITKTHVVSQTGAPADSGNIILRTLVRYIPFEQVSYLFSSQPIGLHDKLSKTRVVND